MVGTATATTLLIGGCLGGIFTRRRYQVDHRFAKFKGVVDYRVSKTRSSLSAQSVALCIMRMIIAYDGEKKKGRAISLCFLT